MRNGEQAIDWSIREEGGQLGVWTLRLLAERLAVRVLRGLTDGPSQPSELEQRLPEVAHSGLMRQLDGLVLARAVARERISAVPPRAYYRLTDGGRASLPICAAAEYWERRWPSLVQEDGPCVWTLQLLADESTRAMLRALAGDPLRPIELDRRVSGVSRSATRRRLGYLLANGIVHRAHVNGEVRYELTAGAHRLGLITTLAARWELQWGRNLHLPPSL